MRIRIDWVSVALVVVIIAAAIGLWLAFRHCRDEDGQVLFLGRASVCVGRDGRIIP